MQVIFVNYNEFIDSSGIHIYFLANELEKMGISCTACIPSYQTAPFPFGNARFPVYSYDDFTNLIHSDPGSYSNKDTYIHAWTPRENVRLFTQKISALLGLPYYLHLEDNEAAILERELGRPLEEIKKSSRKHLNEVLPKNIINPYYYDKFIRRAAGVTCIIDTLFEFVPAMTPNMAFWPSCEKDFFHLPLQHDLNIRDKYGINKDSIVIGYTGNIHKSNAADLKTLYESIYRLKGKGLDVILLRAGSNACEFESKAGIPASDFVIELGSCDAGEILGVISTSNILVQPGSVNEFNKYRFPSKLPMCLASARPVILPRTNIGNYLEDGKNCLFITKGTVEELVSRLEILITEPELRRRIGYAGREFAKANFNWTDSARKIIDFYTKTSVRFYIQKIIKSFYKPFYNSSGV